VGLSELDRRLLDEFQDGMAVEARPYASIAAALGITEDRVIERLRVLRDKGSVSRVGPVFRPNRVGVSTLVALAVPHERLLEIAELVNGYAEVNHNYERDHRYNLWFVVTAPDRAHLNIVLDEIVERTGLDMLDLPMLEDFFVDLGFRLQWT
jgi:DNA-binding Lrp family transcriptional regulator